jgi:branched-chain amino acid aminotransferase
MAPTLAILDGTVMDVAQAQIPVTDDGLLRGDGVFEVLRIYAGRPFGMDEHLDRMARSAETLRLPFDADAVRADATALIAEGEPGDAMLRLVVTRGGRRIGMLETTRRRACSTASSRSPTPPTC